MILDGVEMTEATARQCMSRDGVSPDIQDQVILMAQTSPASAPEGFYWRTSIKGVRHLVRKGREAKIKEEEMQAQKGIQDGPSQEDQQRRAFTDGLRSREDPAGCMIFADFLEDRGDLAMASILRMRGQAGFENPGSSRDVIQRHIANHLDDLIKSRGLRPLPDGGHCVVSPNGWVQVKAGSTREVELVSQAGLLPFVDDLRFRPDWCALAGHYSSEEDGRAVARFARDSGAGEVVLESHSALMLPAHQGSASRAQFEFLFELVSKPYPGLHTLVLDSVTNSYGERALSIGETRNLPGLKNLYMSTSDSLVSEMVLRGLAKNDSISLETLSTGMGSLALQGYVASPQVQSLRTLILIHATGQDISAVASTPYLQNLQSLDVRHCVVGLDAQNHLFHSTRLPNLKTVFGLHQSIVSEAQWKERFPGKDNG